MKWYNYGFASLEYFQEKLPWITNNGRQCTEFEMEFPNLGQQCAIGSCKQLDFLPFACNQCKLTYCLEHKGRDAHSCPVKDDVEELKEPLITQTYDCSLEDCKIKEFVPVACPECQKNFCMRHRHQQDHSCEKLVQRDCHTATPKEKVESIIGRQLNVVKKEHKPRKATKTAAKVALMKMKMHATGDKGIPQNEREYFSVELPECACQNDVVQLFFSKKWSIGKLIDNIAELQGLSNKNNISGEKKLRLLNIDDIVIDPRKLLEDVIDEGLIDLDSRRLKLSYS